MTIINWQRVGGVILRHLFTWPRSLERVADAFWWPSFNLFTWGLLTYFLKDPLGSPQFFLSLFLGGVVMWMIVSRAQEEIGLVFLQEAWDRNLLNLFSSPLTIAEFNLAAIILGFVKLVLATIWMLILSYFLFAFDLFRFGWVLVPYTINLLLTGWSVGLFINGLIVRYGYRVQVFAWTLILVLQPFSAVFYPLDAMPSWIQVIAKVIPPSYIFEGMRTVLNQDSPDYGGLIWATGLNLIYLMLSVRFFAAYFRKARESGMLIKFGQ